MPRKKSGPEIIAGLKRDLEQLFEIEFDEQNSAEDISLYRRGSGIMHTVSFTQTCSKVVKDLERLMEEHNWSLECQKCERAGIDSPLHPDKLRRRLSRLSGTPEGAALLASIRPTPK